MMNNSGYFQYPFYVIFLLSVKYTFNSLECLNLHTWIINEVEYIYVYLIANCTYFTNYLLTLFFYWWFLFFKKLSFWSSYHIPFAICIASTFSQSVLFSNIDLDLI